MVEDLYKLENNPEPEGGFYKIRVVEFEKEESYFKDFELIKITHPEDVNIGVVNNGIVGYKNIEKPTKILLDNEEIDYGEEVLRDEGEDAYLEFKNFDKEKNLLISESSLRQGDRRIEEVDNLLSENKERSIVDFTKKALIVGGALSGAYYAYGCTSGMDSKRSIHYYTIIGEKEREIAVSHPREMMSTHILDLSSYTDSFGEKVKIKMNWTDTHKTVPIGMARRVSEEELDIQTITPEKIEHSDNGENKMKLSPGEALTVSFPAESENDSKETTFLVRSRGYYERVD